MEDGIVVMGRRWPTAVGMVALVLGVVLDLAGLLGAPTPLWAWAWQTGLIVGGLLVLLMFWWTELGDLVGW